MSDATIVETVGQTAEVQGSEVKTEVQEVQKEVTQEASAKPEEVKKPEVVKVDLHTAAMAIAEKLGNLVVRPTDSAGYRILGTKENTDLNWRKGLFYVVNQYSKGFNLEMQAYSVKKGAHLAEFNPKFQPLGNTATDAGDQIAYEKFGLACRLRIKLPYATGLEEMVKKAESFIKAVEPTVAEVRALLKDEDFIKAPKKVVSKKETPAPVTAPVTEVKPVETKAEVPAEAPAEAPVQEPAKEEPKAEPAAPKATSKASKKNDKRK